MGPLDKHILSEDALSAHVDGVRLRFRSHWYRSLPMSCMAFSLKIDGRPVEPADVNLEINGNRYPASNMAELSDEWLFIQDAATIHLPGASFQPGQNYSIEFKLDLSIPYILLGGEGKPLLASSVVQKALVCS